MKILLAIDGTDCSKMAIDNIAQRQWHEQDSFLVLSVIEPLPEDCDEDLEAEAREYESHMKLCCKEITKAGVDKIKESHPDNKIESKVVEGKTVDQIVQCAADWSADLIVVGSMGHQECRRFMHGSIAQAVLKQAPCSVEVIKEKVAH